MKVRHEVVLYMADEPQRSVVVAVRPSLLDAQKVASMLTHDRRWNIHRRQDVHTIQFSWGTLVCHVRRPQVRDDDEGVQFWLQTRAPAGNWVDSLGSNDIFSCIEHGKWFVKERHHDADSVRVIERLDIPKWVHEKAV